jgi:hypothetical protein
MRILTVTIDSVTGKILDDEKFANQAEQDLS